MAHTKVTKTYSQNTGVANTFSYSGSFDVFKGTEVVALLDNIALTYTATTINEGASPREYTVDTVNKTIHIGGANLSSGVVVIRPETDMGAPTPRATYTPGASITSDDLNNNNLQLLRKALEYDEQKLSSLGGTMTGHLTMGEDTHIIFEGASDDAHETTLTVADPSADRTITIPNVTGTIVTTGDTATVTATMMAANSVDSSELVDGSIDASHIANDAVNSQHYAAGSIDLEHMSANSVDSDQYVDGSIDLAHMSANSVDSDQYVDGSIDHVHLAADAVDGDNIADDSIDSEHYVDGSIDLAHMSANSVDSDQYVDGSIDLAHMSANSVDSDQYVDGSIDLAHMSANSVDSDQYVDGSIDTAHIADAQVTLDKVANVTDGQIIVGNGSNRPAAVAVSGDVTIANTGAVTIANDAVEIGMIGCEQTTISDSDSHIPTSGAVVDYVAAQLAPIGGLEVIADDESFPNTIPSAGVVISITDAAGLSVNSSGVSTNADTLDNSTVTINGFPSELRGGVGSNADPYVFQSGAGLMVQSTGSSHTYNYHQAMIRESDFVQLSDDINDFNARYRVAAGASGVRTGQCGANGTGSGNYPCDGDLCWFTGSNKMYVFDAPAASTSNSDLDAAWTEVSSVGDYKILTVKDNGEAAGGAGPTFNASNTQYDLFDGNADASITNAQQLIVVLNGVIQKPNSGSYDGNEEGFYLDGSDGIRFCDGPPANSTLFVTQIGTATTINTPGTGSISNANMFAAGVINAAAIGTGAVEHAKLDNDCVDGDNLADNACDSEHYTDGSIDHVHLAGDCVDGDNLADNACDSEHYTDGSIDHAHLADDCVDGDNIADNSVGLAAMAHGTDGNLITYNASGEPAHVATGNAGQVLTSAGAGAPPTFATISTSDTLSFRNYARNGAMHISQRGTSFTATGDEYTLDGWKHASGSGFTFDTTTSQEQSGGPDGFPKYLKTTPDTTQTPSGSHNAIFEQFIEGQDLQGLLFGTSSAKSITLSFWARSAAQNANHQYGVWLQFYNSSGTRYIQTKAFTVTASWQRFTVTMSGNTAQNIRNNNDIGIRFGFMLSAGSSDIESEITSWQQSASYKAPTGQDNFMDNTSNEFHVTGVQLEAGTAATDFEHVPYQTDYWRNRRYFQFTDYGQIGYGSGKHVNDWCYVHFALNPPMRTTPSKTMGGTSVNGTGNNQSTAVFSSGGLCHNLLWQVQGGDATDIYANGVNAEITLSAELL